MITKKMYLYIGAIAAFIALLVACWLGWQRASIYKQREQTQRNNVGALMQDVERYKIDDSLNAVRVQGLTLTIDDLKRYRAEDAALIKKMDVKPKHAGAIVKVRTNTVTKFRTMVKDSIVYLPTDTVYLGDTMKCINIYDKWYTLNGCINKAGEFKGTLNTYDKINIVETVKYKRFLFWRTNKVKSRKIDAVSDNPNTTITGCEFITITK